MAWTVAWSRFGMGAYREHAHRREHAFQVRKQVFRAFNEFSSLIYRIAEKSTHNKAIFMPYPSLMRTVISLADNARLAICADDVVASQVEGVHRSGVDMARAVAVGWSLRGGRSGFVTIDRRPGLLVEARQ